MNAADLRPFCSTDPMRRYINRPWSRGEFTFATDGHIIVRVPRLPNVKENKKAPSCDQVFVKTAGQLELEPLPDLSVLPRVRKGKCETCRGSGREHECPDCQCRCGECNGLGKIENTASATLNGAIFNAEYLKMIAALPGAKFYASPPPDGPARFVFDGGEGAVMPRIRPLQNHVEIGRPK